jgi:Protein of unknown function (DUF2846)
MVRDCFTIVIASAFLASCASSGPTGTEVLNESIKSNIARLVIYRASSMGFAVQPDYMIDGKRAATSQAGGFVVCNLPPGHHEIAVDNLAISNNFFGSGSEKMSIDLRAGSTTYVSASPQMGLMTPGQITLMNVTENQGRSDTASLHKTDSSCSRT